MALDIDTSRPLRRPAELTRLVRAVREADPNDESSWLEWKSQLDLASAAGRFHIVKAILGMANRMPALAQSNCGGIGYVVIGAEPGRLPGIVGVDPAQLDDGLSPYVGGARGPGWSATYVEVKSRSVLLVMVEPPRMGDPIYTLRKSYENAPAGTVFVRKNGKTAPADDHDLDLLQTRLQTSSNIALDLEVSAVGDIPLSWADPSEVESAIQSWADARRSDLIAEAKRALQSGSPKVSDPSSRTQGFTQRLDQVGRLPNPLLMPDKRTFDDYAAEVEKWAGDLNDSAQRTWPARYASHGHGTIRLQVRNPTDRNLRDVLIKAEFPGEAVVGLDLLPFVDRLPRPPRKYGEPQDLGLVGLPIVPTALRDLDLAGELPVMRSTWVEDGSVRIGWSVGDLRPREIDESDDVYIFVRGPIEEGSLKGVWEATSKSTNGVLEGEISIPLAEEPVDISLLLEASDSD